MFIVSIKTKILRNKTIKLIQMILNNIQLLISYITIHDLHYLITF